MNGERLSVQGTTSKRPFVSHPQPFGERRMALWMTPVSDRRLSDLVSVGVLA
jgi:hypothetical protein